MPEDLQDKSALLIDLLRVIEALHDTEGPTGLSAVIDAAQSHAQYINDALEKL